MSDYGITIRFDSSQLDQGVQKTQAQLGNVGSAAAQAQTKVDGLQKAFAQAGVSTGLFSGSLRDVLVTAGAFVGFTSLIDAANKAIETISQLSGQFKTLQKDLLLTDAQTESTRAKIMDMTAGTADSATKAATAFGILGKAGVTMKDSFTALEHVNELADKMHIETAAAATIAADALTKGKVKVDDLDDALRRLKDAAHASNIDVAKIGDVFANINQTLAKNGMEENEIVAYATALAALGKSGSDALKDFGELAQMATKPSKEIRESLEYAGVAAGALNLNTHEFSTVLATASKAGLQIPQAFKDLASKDGKAAIAAITQFVALSEKAAEAADKIKKGFSLKDIEDGWEKLKNTVIAIMSDLGAGGGYGVGTVLLNGALTGVVALAQAFRALLPVISGIATAIAIAFAPTIISTFISLAGQAAVALRGMTAAMMAFALANPFTAIVAAIGGLAAILASYSDQIIVDAKAGMTLRDIWGGTLDYLTVKAEKWFAIWKSGLNTIVSEAREDASLMGAIWGVLFGKEVGAGMGQEWNTQTQGGFSTSTQAATPYDYALGEIAKRQQQEAEAAALQKQVQEAKAATQQLIMESAKRSGQGQQGQDLMKEEFLRLNDMKEAAGRIDAIGKLMDQGRISADKYSDRLQELRQQILKYDQTTFGGIEKGLNEISKGFTKWGDNLATFMKGTFDKISDAIATFATTGKLNFHDFVNSILADLIKLQTNRLFGQLAQGILGAIGGSNLGGNSSTNFGGIGKLFGFAEGGTVEFGGTGGPDSQLFMARVTPGEVATFKTPQQVQNERTAAGSSAPVINIVNNSGSQVRTQQRKGAGGASITDVIIGVVGDALGSGSLDGALRGRYGTAVSPIRR